jgi:hypothetical protein
MPDISFNGLLAVAVFPPIALALLRDGASADSDASLASSRAT